MNVNIEELFTEKNIKFESIHFEVGKSDFDIDREVNTDVREVGNFVVFIVNDLPQLALVSANYQLSKNRIKQALHSEKFEIASCLPSDVISVPKIASFLIDSNLYYQIEEIFFKMESKCTVLKVKTCEILSKYENNYNVVDLRLLPKRKAKIQFESPILVDNPKLYLQTNGCIFLISLVGSLHFTRSKILTQLEEITKIFAHCTVLIIDSGHRLNLTSQDVSEEDALDFALELGEKFLRNHKITFERYQEQCEFKFILGSQVQKTNEYNAFYEQIKNIYQVFIKQ
eukprot:TRINITY_DN6084_c0_g2_i1.p1 TRINITY_DN6084_c0_g2~~TRINITY_DN6084_c0_g2_i1.p1  ORF type:complete len:298 (+),score=6.44 TRINITY_DN6084_c0_g2_i1:40-894(+)